MQTFLCGIWFVLNPYFVDFGLADATVLLKYDYKAWAKPQIRTFPKNDQKKDAWVQKW